MGGKVSREEFLPKVPDQSGRVVLITGGNSGLGFEAASILLEKGATVVLACRNETKAIEAVGELKVVHPNASVSYLLFDASKRNSIDKLMDDVKDRFEKLNVLINNAGVTTNPKENPITEFGTDYIYTVNLIAPYLLSLGLLGRLQNAYVQDGTPSRIIHISSGLASRVKNVNYDNWSGKNLKNTRLLRYSEAKLGAMMVGHAMNRRCEEAVRTVISLSCNPGFAKTDTAEEVFGKVGTQVAQSTFMGALPIVAAATFEEPTPGSVMKPKRAVWGPPVEVKGPKASWDEEKQEQLWQKLVEVTATDFSIED